MRQFVILFIGVFIHIAVPITLILVMLFVFLLEQTCCWINDDVFVCESCVPHVVFETLNGIHCVLNYHYCFVWISCCFCVFVFLLCCFPLSILLCAQVTSLFVFWVGVVMT